MRATNWILAPQPETDWRAISRELRLSEIAARLLCRRGCATPQRANAFLNRHLDQLHEPALLPDIAPALARIAQALEKNERIVLFGDYDADGVTATALLARFLKLLQTRAGKENTIVPLVPERKHGYGLSAHAVREIRAHEPDLVITLDNGISARDPVETLSAAGIDCIIVDHHHAEGGLPRAKAVINPKRTDAENRYPFAELCGVGVAFKLAWALAVQASGSRKIAPELKAFLLEALALAALGTVADVVPLIDENRVLAHHGLKVLAKTALPGLRALLETAAIKPDKHGAIKAGDVAFRLAPRLNAAGRCGHAAEALELLLTDDAARAGELAAKLEKYNVQRQKMEADILDEARTQAQAALAANPALRGLVLQSPEWHLGVIGIVASRLVDEFNRPTLLLGTNPDSGHAQGSGRSIHGLHLCEALGAARECLLAFGGHAAAAGVTLEWSKVEAFRASFEATTAALLRQEDLVPRLHVDEQIGLPQVTAELCAELELFEPCGMGNARPLFAVFGAALCGLPKLMGQAEKHLNFFVQQGRVSRRVVGFNCADRFNALCDLSSNGGVDLAFRPQTNTFRGETSVELIMEAFRPAQ